MNTGYAILMGYQRNKGKFKANPQAEFDEKKCKRGQAWIISSRNHSKCVFNGSSDFCMQISQKKLLIKYGEQIERIFLEIAKEKSL